MNTWQKRTVAALAVALVGAGGWGATSAQADPTTAPGPGRRASAPATAVVAPADATLKANLALMRDEERMARDLYRALADTYGQDTPFARIAVSEQRHFEAVGVLLTRYGLDDPSAGKAAGVYSDSHLQGLYDRLLAQGKESLQEAYKVGVEVETVDIADLEAALTVTTAADATRVFTNLKSGSENHLAAFTAYRDGKTPEPGTMQQGRGRGMGQGMGRSGQADCPLR